jgi:hypothetical protein
MKSLLSLASSAGAVPVPCRQRTQGASTGALLQHISYQTHISTLPCDMLLTFCSATCLGRAKPSTHIPVT